MYNKGLENFSLAGSSTNSHYQVFCLSEGQKMPNYEENQ